MEGWGVTAWLPIQNKRAVEGRSRIVVGGRLKVKDKDLVWLTTKNAFKHMRADCFSYFLSSCVGGWWLLLILPLIHSFRAANPARVCVLVRLSSKVNTMLLQGFRGFTQSKSQAMRHYQLPAYPTHAFLNTGAEQPVALRSDRDKNVEAIHPASAHHQSICLASKLLCSCCG